MRLYFTLFNKIGFVLAFHLLVKERRANIHQLYLFRLSFSEMFRDFDHTWRFERMIPPEISEE